MWTPWPDPDLTGKHWAFVDLPYQDESFYHERIVSNAFSASVEVIVVVFVLYSINVYYINRFWDVKLTLHSWSWMVNSFYLLLDSFANVLWRFMLSLAWLCSLCNTAFLAWAGKCLLFYQPIVTNGVGRVCWPVWFLSPFFCLFKKNWFVVIICFFLLELSNIKPIIHSHTYYIYFLSFQVYLLIYLATLMFKIFSWLNL